MSAFLMMAGPGITSAAAAPIIAAGVSAQAPPGAIFENWDTCFLGVGAPCVSFTGVRVNNFGGSMFNIGAIPGVSAEPVLSGGQGAPWGLPDGPDTSLYLTVVGGGSTEVLLGGLYDTVGLIIGSLDTYNTIEGRLGATTVDSIVTGTDIFNNPSGDQGVMGTFLVQLHFSSYIDTLWFRSGQNSAEYSGIYLLDSKKLPEPATWLVMGLGVLALFGGTQLLRRRRIGDTMVAA